MPATPPICSSSCKLSIIADPTVSGVSNILTIRGVCFGELSHEGEILRGAANGTIPLAKDLVALRRTRFANPSRPADLLSRVRPMANIDNSKGVGSRLTKSQLSDRV